MDSLQYLAELKSGEALHREQSPTRWSHCWSAKALPVLSPHSYPHHAHTGPFFLVLILDLWGHLCPLL